MNPELELVKIYAKKVVEQGFPVIRETLSDSYYEQINTTEDNEPESVSEIWIDYFWKKLSGLDKEALNHGLKSDLSLTTLAYKVLGK